MLFACDPFVNSRGVVSAGDHERRGGDARVFGRDGRTDRRVGIVCVEFATGGEPAVLVVLVSRSRVPRHACVVARHARTSVGRTA